MTFLIGKMFVYLLIAFGAGGAAGWLWRNRDAAAREEGLQMELGEARGRVTQLEAQVQNREDRLRQAAVEKDDRRKEARGAEREATDAVEELSRVRRKLEQALEREDTLRQTVSLQQAMDGDEAVLDGEVAEHERALEQRMGELETQLERAGSALAKREAQLQQQGAQAAALQKDQALLKNSLEEAQRHVSSLERERDLQNKSLKVLHQQLALERERAVPRTASS